MDEEIKEVVPEKNIVEQAKTEREALTKENERLEANIKNLRELEANKILGGTAGGRIEAPKAVETAKDYANKVMTGKIKAK